MKLIPVGPGMFTQAEENCTNCEGLGDLFGEGGKCTHCDGKKIAKQEVNLSVKVEAGVPPGEVICLEGEGN